MKLFFARCTALLLTTAAALGYTNVLEDGASQTVTNLYDASGMDIWVGNLTSSNSMNVVTGGSVTNLNTYVGGTSNAFDNTVVVSGTDASWIHSGVLAVGTQGNSNNSVTVENDGIVSTSNLVVYAGNDFNLNDGGTLAVTADFDLSPQTNLNWNTGGTLSVEGMLTGLTTTNEGTYLGDGKNLILNGGTFSTTTNLIIGYESSNTSLSITNGGGVANADGYIGWGTNSADNSVQVSGNGSAWTNTGNLYVGVYGSSTNLMDAGSGNSLTVSNNAWVFVGGADTNLTAPGSGGVAVASNASMVVGSTADVSTEGLYIDDAGDFDLFGSLTVNGSFNAGQTGFNWNNGGSLSVSSNLTGIIGFDGTNKTLTLNGGTWDNGFSDLYVGLAGDGNTLSVLNTGTVVTAGSLFIGSGGGVSNTLNVADGSVVTVGSDLRLDPENTLNLDSGTVSVAGNMFIISNATVSGAGSVEFNDSEDNLLDFDPDHGAISGNVLFDGRAGANTIRLSGGDQDLSAADFVTLNHTNFSTLHLFDGNDRWTASSADTNGTFGSISTISGGSGTDRLIYGPGEAPQKMEDSLLGTTYFNFEVLDLGVDDNIWAITALDSGILIDGGTGANTLWSTGGTLTVTTDNFSSDYMNFSTLNLTNNNLAGRGVLDGLDTINMVGGDLNPNGTLQIDGTFNGNGATYFAEVGAASSDLLHFTSAVDLSSVTANVEVLSVPLDSLKATIVLVDEGVAGAFAATNLVERLFLYDVSLQNLQTNTIDVVAKPREGEISSTLTYAGVQGIRSGFNGMKNAVFVRTKQLRRNSVATDYAISKDAYLMTPPDEPAGAYGPGDNNMIFGMHFWAEQYSGQGDYDSIGNSEGFTLNSYGTTFGLDRMIEDSLIVGINYTYARSSASQSGDRVKTETYWVGLYGEWLGPDGFYLDGLAGVGSSDYETRRREFDYFGTGSFDGTEVGGHLEVGKYLHHNNWAFAPYLGMNYLWIDTDSYSEEGFTDIEVDGETVTSLESAVGFKLRNRFDTRAGRIQTVGYLEWAHDFINDDIDSSLSDGSVTVTTAKISPDEDMLNTGIGISWTCTDYLEVGLGYDGRFNENYEEHTGSIMMDVMF